MVYADTDFFLALVKKDDWLRKNAEIKLEEIDKIETSLTTFIELCLIAKRYDFKLEEAAAEIMQIAETDFDENIVFQAIHYQKSEGLNTFDAFQAAKSNGKIISSDKEFDKLDIERIKLEEK